MFWIGMVGGILLAGCLTVAYLLGMQTGLRECVPVPPHKADRHTPASPAGETALPEWQQLLNFLNYDGTEMPDPTEKK